MATTTKTKAQAKAIAKAKKPRAPGKMVRTTKSDAPEAFAVFPSEFGTCAIAWSAQGVTALNLPEANEKTLRARLAARGAIEAAPKDVPAAMVEAIATVQKHLAGEVQDMSHIALDLARVPAFHTRVYLATRQIPSGETLTYGGMADKLAAKGAQRAIGQAMGRNPIPVIVPCHRILAAGNAPGGFSSHGGITTKSRLLVLEERAAKGLPPSRVPFDTERAAREMSAADPKLGHLIKRVGPPNLKARPALSTFEALAESIVYQQLHAKAAATIFARLRFAVQPFTAVQLSKTREAALVGAGLSAGKLAALRDLAARCIVGTVPDLRDLAGMPDEEIIEKLTSIRGIGPWTVDMILIFRLGRSDILPVGDFGVRKGMQVTYGLKEMPDEAAMRKRAEKWRPWRSLGSWYMWRAADEATENAKAKNKTETDDGAIG